MSNAKAEFSTKRELGSATAIAVLCMIPLAGAAAQGGGGQISGGRAAAIHECSVLASRYSQHDWGNVEMQARNRETSALARLIQHAVTAQHVCVTRVNGKA